MNSFKKMIYMNFIFGLVFGLLFIQDAQAVRQYSFGTASTGGTWYIVGAGLASHVNNQIPDIKITAEVTQGTIENFNLMKREKLDLILSKPDIISDDIIQKAYGGGAKEKISQFMWSYMMNDYHYVVKENSPIKTLRDIKGRKFSIGPHASTTQVMTRRFLKTVYGYEPEKDFKPYYYPFSEGQTALKDGNVEIAHNSGGAPVSSLIDLSSTLRIRFIPIRDDEVDKFQKEWPGKVVRAIISKGTYRGLDQDLRTIGEPTGILASPQMPEEDVYKIFKALFTNVDQRNTVHPTIKKYTIEATLEYGAEVAKLGIPFHPGVKKYLMEIGKWNPKLEAK